MSDKIMYNTIQTILADLKRKLSMDRDETIKGKYVFEQVPDGIGATLGGTNYVFVRGDGTPEENAVELQEAYNRAKTMPIYRGLLSGVKTFYIGQTFESSENNIFYRVTSNYTGNVSEVIDFAVQVTEEEAKSVRTTVVVAPGKYTIDGDYFDFDANSVNVVSLTGKPDVIFNGSAVIRLGDTSSNRVSLFRGLNSQSLFADMELCPSGITFENCVGGIFSFFGAGGSASGTFKDCVGGDYSFGGEGHASGTFINCTGGDYSFGGGGGTASGTFTNCTGGSDSFGGTGGGDISSTGRLYYCRLTSGVFTTPAAGGKLVGCIDGTGKIINTDSQLSYRVYFGLFTQSGTSAPTVTVIENTLGVSPVWQRTDAGVYSTTNPVAVADKTFSPQDRMVIRGSNESGAVLLCTTTAVGVGHGFLIMTRTYDDQDTNADDLLFQTFIEFRVYN